MALRNALLIAALVTGIAIIAMMYVRRGLCDIQGQIDAIETVLAEMPPELTSGEQDWAGGSGTYPAPVAADASFGSEASGGGAAGGDGEVGGLGDGGDAGGDGGDATFAPDEALEYTITSADDAAAAPHGLRMEDITEYLVDDEFGVATLSEPGVYESGVVQIDVLPAGQEQKGSIVEVIDLTDNEGEDAEAEHDTDGVDGGDEDSEDAAASPEVPDALAPPPPPPGDEFDILTLPELKARLKATQPGTRGIARMKRAEVLSQLRAMPGESSAE